MKIRSRVVSDRAEKSVAKRGSPSLRSHVKSESFRPNAAEVTIACHVFVFAMAMHGSSAIAENMPVTEQELTCLARNIYFEARNQPTEGQRAVAYVTLNRLEESRNRTTICEVVYRPGWFSWTRHRRNVDREITDRAAWDKAWKIASAAIKDREADPVQGSTFFHSVAVAPNWATQLVKVEQIGDHIFYARPRSLPQPSGGTRSERRPTLDWSGAVVTELARQPELAGSRDRPYDSDADVDAEILMEGRDDSSAMPTFRRRPLASPLAAVREPAF